VIISQAQNRISTCPSAASHSQPTRNAIPTRTLPNLHFDRQTKTHPMSINYGNRSKSESSFFGTLSDSGSFGFQTPK